MVNLLCEHWELFSETWQTSGTMRNGKVYEPQTQVHRTTASESSSLPTPSASQEPGWTVQPVDKDGKPTTNPNERWYHPETGRLMQKGITQVLRENDLLRTPAASEAERGHQPESKARARGGQVTLSGQFMELMPTPNTMDMLPARTPEQKAANKGKGGYANVRETVVNDLMPTPVAAEGTKAPSQQTSEVKRKTGQVWLSNVAKDMEQTNWGKFEPAIRRWEQTLGRPAPSPTKPDGKDGNHRLSSKFTEWMMGLPFGWITEVGLSRNDELKACGNGVVPQQAELALRALLGNSELNKLQDNASLLPTVMANSPMRNSRRSMVTHPTKRSGVALNQALELISGVLPAEFESWDEVPANYQDMNQTEGITMRGKRLKR